MPLVGWHKTCDCPPDFQEKNGTGEVVDCVNLDHYARHCPVPPFSRILAECLYQNELGYGGRYGGVNEVSATMLTSDPLLIYFKKNFPYVEDPIEGRWKLRGTFAHQGLLGLANKGPLFMIEQSLRQLLITDEGVPFYLYGTIDCYDYQTKTLTDMKTQNIFAIDRKNKSTREALLQDQYVRDNIHQVNTYKILLESTLGIPVEKANIEYWDGDLRVFTLEDVPLVPYSKMWDIIVEKGGNVLDALIAESPDQVVADPENMNNISVKRSGVFYLWKEEVTKRNKQTMQANTSDKTL